MPKYCFEVLIALDQFINAVLGGWADETMSSRAWRQKDEYQFWGIARRGIDTLFFWERNHCRNSFIAEELRNQAPVEFREWN